MRAYSLINLADTQGRDNEDALSALRGVDGIEALPLVVVRRKAFPNAFSNDLSVTEQTPGDQKAVGEMLSVVGAPCTHKRLPMAIRVPHAVKQPDPDEKAAAFIAGSTKPVLVEQAVESSKVVVNLRFDAALLAKIDAAAKRQGITRTAWLHRAAFDALGD